MKPETRTRLITTARKVRLDALQQGGKRWTSAVGWANHQLAKLGALPTPPHTPTLRQR